MTKHGRLFHGVLLFVLCGIPAYGQGSPQFDAATVKLLPNGFSTPAMEGGPGTHDPGRATWQRAWLRQLLAKAFHIDNPEDITGPDWIGGNARPVYPFTATMPPDTSRHDFELMLQKFLIEQFKITLHHEQKASPAYDLVVAPGGPKLKASADQSDPTAPDRHYGIPEMDSDGFAILPAGRGSTIVSGPKGMHAIFQQYSISEFAQYLRGFAMTQGGRTPYVVDKTGIAGRYDIRVKFDSRDDVIKAGPEVQAALGAQDPLGPGSGLPTIFKALEQQLGLRLVKTKDILVDTIVIDHAEQMPVGN